MQHDQDSDSGAWAWGPYVVTAGAAGFGWVLRLAAGGMGLAVAAGLLLVPPIVLAVAYARGRYLLGVDRRGELVYAAGVLVALAGWVGAAGMTAWPEAALVAAAVTGAAAGWQLYGPGRRPAGLALSVGVAVAVVAGLLLGAAREPNPARWAVVWLTATSCAAAPWWRYQRGRRRPVEPPPAAEDVQPLTTAIVKHLRAPVDVIPDSLATGDHGRYSVRYLLTDGRNARHLQAITETLESELSLRPGAVSIEGSRTRRDEAVVTVVPSLPNRGVLKRPEPPTSITEPFSHGVYDDGGLLQLTLYTEIGARGALYGGVKGSGKSSGVDNDLIELTAVHDAVFMIADLSGGALSQPWSPLLAWEETTPDKALVMIHTLIDVARARAAMLPGLGWKSWQPSPQMPAIVFVLDEAQALLATNTDAQAALAELIQIDRKSGISVIVSLPYPTVQFGVTKAIREQLATRVCYRSPGGAADWVLGDTKAASIKHLVSEFDDNTPGLLLAAGPGVRPMTARGFPAELPDIKAAVARNTARRPALDPTTDARIRDSIAAWQQAVRAKAEKTNTTLAPDALTLGFGFGSGSAAPAPPASPETSTADVPRWTDADDRALRKVSTVDDEQLRDQLRSLTDSPDVLGRPWPEHPKVARPSKGDLTTAQALRIARDLVAQPGGTTPRALIAGTGRSRSWVMDVLKAWVKDGVAVKVDAGLYVAAISEELGGLDTRPPQSP